MCLKLKQAQFFSILNHFSSSHEKIKFLSVTRKSDCKIELLENVLPYLFVRPPFSRKKNQVHYKPTKTYEFFMCFVETCWFNEGNDNTL